MKSAPLLALAFMLTGCMHRAPSSPVASTFPIMPISHEVMQIDVPEGETESAVDTTIRWTPRTANCYVSFLSKSLRDKGLKSIQILDAANKPVGSIELEVRPDDKSIVGATVLKGHEELHFQIPHASKNEIAGILMTEDFTQSQWEDFHKRGAGACVQVDTSYRKSFSPMVRVPGDMVELKWEETERQRPTKPITSIRLSADLTTLGKVATDRTSGALGGKNLGSIQFALTTKPSQRHRFLLSFH